jgi:hypothetical protein
MVSRSNFFLDDINIETSKNITHFKEVLKIKYKCPYDRLNI